MKIRIRIFRIGLSVYNNLHGGDTLCLVGKRPENILKQVTKGLKGISKEWKVVRTRTVGLGFYYETASPKTVSVEIKAMVEDKIKR